MSASSKTVLLAGVNKGCRFNNVLLTRARRFLYANGHKVTQDPAAADTVIFSSCGVFTGYVDETLQRAREYTRGGEADVIIAGCMTKSHPDEKVDEPHLIFVDDLSALDTYFDAERKFETFGTHTTQELINDSFAYTEPGNTPADRRREHLKNKLLYALLPRRSRLLAVLKDIDRRSKHFVEIGRGCIGDCTYCIEKRVTPEVLSRPLERILQDIDDIEDDHITLCLTADDCGAYGIDIGESLFSLLDAIGARFPNIKIEVSNIYPGWVVDDPTGYADKLAASRVCSLNIPLQSGSQQVLRRMNRVYDPEVVIQFIKHLKARSPDTLIWSHIIVGFPGETEQDFEQSLKYLDAYDYLFAFPYSRNPGTESADFDDQVPGSIVKRRHRRIKREMHKILIKRFIEDIFKRRSITER